MSGEQQQTALVAGLGVLAGVAGTVALLAGGWVAFGAVGLAAAVALGTAATVPVPFGGAVPLSYALLIALAELRTTGDYLVMVGGGAAVALLVLAARRGAPETGRTAARLALGTGLGVVAAGAVHRASWADGAGVLGRTLAIGVVVLIADAAAARMVEPAPHRLHYRPAAPIYLILLCGAALIAVAHEEAGAWMATIAIFPLLITRFSFQRHAGAHETFSQTVQALGIVPELAAMAPLGHSERTAVYADRLATALGFAHRDHDRIILAARLHHLGAVSLDHTEPEPATAPDATATALQGGTILREAGFPGDVAALIEDARAGSFDGAAPSLEAAVLRVASTFDDLVGDEPARADHALAIIASQPRDPYSRRTVATMLGLMAEDHALVHRAIDAGARFTEAAEGLDLAALARGAAGGELLPFARRRR